MVIDRYRWCTYIIPVHRIVSRETCINAYLVTKCIVPSKECGQLLWIMRSWSWLILNLCITLWFFREHFWIAVNLLSSHFASPFHLYVYGTYHSPFIKNGWYVKHLHISFKWLPFCRTFCFPTLFFRNRKMFIFPNF